MPEKWKNDIVALVPAAGKGIRLDLGPKAFLQIEGRSLILRVVNVLTSCVDRILVGVPNGYLKRSRQDLSGIAEVYPGGKSRQETILFLFKRCTEQIILIHDVIRPFASRNLILKVIDTAIKFGAAVACIPSQIPVSWYNEGFITESIPRSQIRLTQSPQAFHRDILDKAYRNALETGIEDQTTWELVVRLGIPVKAVEGEEQNIKITTPFDWEIANKVIAPSIDLDEFDGRKKW